MIIGPKVLEMADKIRDIFIRLRRFYRHQDNYDPSPKWQKDFIKAAEMVFELGADPYDFVRAQFEVLKLSPIIQPNCLHGERAKQRYIGEGSPDMLRQEAHKRLLQQVERLQAMVNSGMNLEFLLLEDSTEFEPILRAVIGEISGLPAVVEKYKSEAIEEAKDKPAIRQVIAVLFPERSIEWL